MARKKTDRGRCTHFLKMAEIGTCQDMERNRPSMAHSHTGDGRGRDLSGHEKKTDRARHTHSLETAEEGTCQDMERKRLGEGHSPTGDGRRRDLSGHGKKSTKRGALTNWRRHRVRIVRTRKETDRGRHTHCLETAEGGTYQDTERKRQSKAHSPTGGGRGRDLSGHGKKPTE
jgi:hypothetical protein